MTVVERQKLRRVVRDVGLYEASKRTSLDRVTLLKLLSDDVVPTSPGSQAVIRAYLRGFK